MSKLKLVLGTKNLSSWSLRPWLFMRQFGLLFDEEVIELDREETEQNILLHSPSGKVPVLIDGDVRVWESLAICDYLAEKYSLPGAWPFDAAARGHARAIACEMHAGFGALRRELPFKAARRPDATVITDDARRDIARVRHIWREARTRFGHNGDWLFGRFGVADAMFAPVAIRLHTYAIAIDGPEADYLQTVLNAPAMREWIEAAAIGAWPYNAAAAQANAPVVPPPPEPLQLPEVAPLLSAEAPRQTLRSRLLPP